MATVGETSSLIMKDRIFSFHRDTYSFLTSTQKEWVFGGDEYSWQGPLIWGGGNDYFKIMARWRQLWTAIRWGCILDSSAWIDSSWFIWFLYIYIYYIVFISLPQSSLSLLHSCVFSRELLVGPVVRKLWGLLHNTCKISDMKGIRAENCHVEVNH